MLDEAIHERNRQLGRRRVGETGAPSASQVGEERELAHDQQRAGGIGDCQVGPPGVVLEIAHADQLVAHAIDDLLRVVDPDPGEHERAAPDLPEQLLAGADGRAGHALNDETHRLRAKRTGLRWTTLRARPG